MYFVALDEPSLRNAFGLLTQHELKYLNSEDKWKQGIVRGKLMESEVYFQCRENVSRISAKTIIRKYGDVPESLRMRAKIGQNGLFYDEEGKIVARGNGLDLAEFDLLYEDKARRINFAEIKSSRNNLSNFDKEIAYKRKILDYVFNQKNTHCLIFSPASVSRTTMSKLFASDPNVTLVEIPEINLKVPPESPEFLQMVHSKESIYLTELNQRPFNYKRIHDELRDGITTGHPIGCIKTSEPSSLVSRIILGTVCESDLAWLLNYKQFFIDGRRLDPSNFYKNFQNIVLSLSMPDARPVLFLRGRQKDVYLKLGARSVNEFDFERNIWPYRTVLFKWLDESKKDTLTKGQIQSILKNYLRKANLKLNKKYGERPAVS